MKTKKESKTGFWASLFSPKSCSCSSDKNVSKENIETATMCRSTNENTNKENDTIEIKVLGPGCSKCKTTYQLIEKTVKEQSLNAKLTKVEDIVEIMSYNVIGTPAVVVNGVVKIKGHVPSESEIKHILGI